MILPKLSLGFTKNLYKTTKSGFFKWGGPENHIGSTSRTVDPPPTDYFVRRIQLRWSEKTTRFEVPKSLSFIQRYFITSSRNYMSWEESFPFWEIASGINASLNVVLLFYFERCPQKAKGKEELLSKEGLSVFELASRNRSMAKIDQILAKLNGDDQSPFNLTDIFFQQAVDKLPPSKSRGEGYLSAFLSTGDYLCIVSYSVSETLRSFTRLLNATDPKHKAIA